MKKKIVFIVTFLVLLISFSVSVSAAGTSKKIKEGVSYTNYDFDGDGEDDYLEGTAYHYNDFDGVIRTGFYIFLNDEIIFETDVRGEAIPSVDYIKMGNGEQVYLISMVGYNEYCYMSCLYKYGSDHQLKRIANLKTVQRGCWTHIGTSPWKLTVGDSSLKILCSTQLGGIGRIDYTIPYIIKNGKASLSYTTMLINNRYHPSKGKFTVSKPFTAYTRAYQGKKVYTSKVGQKAEVTHVYFGASYSYIKVKIGNKAGWVKMPNSDKTYFREAYFAA